MEPTTTAAAAVQGLSVIDLIHQGWYATYPLIFFSVIVLSIVLAIAAGYEFIEWGSTYVFAADVGQAFLGSQGDPWDAQWDMLLGLIGGAAGFFLLAPIHDRSMAKVSAT